MEKYGEVVKVLGRGAFGVASLVKTPSGETRVVKTVDLNDMPPLEREASHKEVGVLRQLKHPHIVAFYDVQLVDVTLLIVMEFADGGDLASAIKDRREIKKPFEDNHALKVFGQCLLALRYIHEKRIVHRDIKSQNVFLMENGDVKIGDFGISKVMETTAAAAGTIVGTPSYLAPEICEDAPYGGKVDIWSMGVVLYELVALFQPFQGGSIAALVMKIVGAEPAPLPEGTSDEICSIAKATLQKKPDDRPSADDLLKLPAVSRNVSSSSSAHPTGMAAYEKIKVLGRGAFGVAMLVKLKDLSATSNPERVIKTVDLSRMAEDAQKKAEEEVHVLRRLAHPHIVAYFDFFVESEKLHIVLEYADGGDLASALKQRGEAYEEKDAMKTFGQCLQALRYIHKKRILHRDIKCPNVLLTKAQDVKLGDFGIAKVAQDTLQEPTELVGTPSYLAPEMCRNDKYDGKVDIWAVGVVLYELLTLKQPFLCSNIAATILKIISDKPSPVPEAASEEVRKIVNLTLQKKPENRPTAADLLSLPGVSRYVSSLEETRSATGGSGLAEAIGEEYDDDWENATKLSAIAEARTMEALAEAGTMKGAASQSTMKSNTSTTAGQRTIAEAATLQDLLRDAGGTSKSEDAQSTLQSTIRSEVATAQSTLRNDAQSTLRTDASTTAGDRTMAENGTLADLLKDAGATPSQPSKAADQQATLQPNSTIAGTMTSEALRGKVNPYTASPGSAEVSPRPASVEETQPASASADATPASAAFDIEVEVMPVSPSIAMSASVAEEETEDNLLDCLIADSERGDVDEMMALVKGIVDIAASLKLPPVYLTAAAVEQWTDMPRMRQTLKSLPLRRDSPEGAVRHILVTEVEKKQFKDEEDYFRATMGAGGWGTEKLNIEHEAPHAHASPRGDPTPMGGTIPFGNSSPHGRSPGGRTPGGTTTHGRAGLGSTAGSLAGSGRIGAASFAGSGRLESEQAGSSAYSASPRPGNPDAGYEEGGFAEDAAGAADDEDELSMLLQQADQGGGPNEMLRLLQGILRCCEEENLNWLDVVKMTVPAWTDPVKAKKILKVDLKSLRTEHRMQREYDVSKLLVAEIEKRLFAEEEAEFLSDGGMGATIAHEGGFAAGHALDAVRQKRSQQR